MSVSATSFAAPGALPAIPAPSTVAPGIAGGAYNPTPAVAAPVSAPVSDNGFIPAPPMTGMPFNPQFNLFRPFNSDPSPEIQAALAVLGQTGNLPADEAYMKHMGLDVVFKNGAEALSLIQNRAIKVVFGDMGDTTAHAQWIQEQNTIMINQNYEGDMNPPTVYAIAAAIYHEAGHAARSGDSQTSIQEELNCLALNTLAYRYHAAMDPNYANAQSTSRLISDGVALYPKLFFDPDPQKQALVNRVIEKYGQLPMESEDHNTPMLPNNVGLAYRIVRQMQAPPPGAAFSMMA